MTGIKRPAKRIKKWSESIGNTNRHSETLEEAIERRQKSFKGKGILYLDTKFWNGIYKNSKIEDIIKINRRYVEWYLTITGKYIADEIVNKLKEV
jgi:hypothetical protein